MSSISPSHPKGALPDTLLFRPQRAATSYGGYSKHTYTYAVYSFWAAVLLVGILRNLTNTILSRRRHSSKAVSSSSIVSCLRANLILSPAFNASKRVLGWCTIPNRLEAGVVGLFYIMVFILAAVPSGITGDFDGVSTPWKGVGDRAAIMTIACLPYVWLFAGRNNIFIWATGYSYQTFSCFHKHLARAATLLAITHAICHTHRFVSTGIYTTMASMLWIQFGIITCTCMGIMLVHSFTWLRRKYYDAFLVIHICLAVVVLVGIFQHLIHYAEVYNPYLWPIVAIWSFDRFLRLVRLAYCNIHVRSLLSRDGKSRPIVTYDNATDVIRLEIPHASPLLKPGPGQYYYVYQPMTWKGWECHPFSLGSWQTSSSSGISTPSSLSPTSTAPSSPMSDLTTASIFDKDIEKTITMDVTTLSSSDEFSTQRPTTTSLTFWIRPYDGWTKRLRDACMTSMNSTTRPHLLIEGPYGHKAPLHAYDTVMLVCGGTGISAALPYILDHIARAEKGTAKTTSLKLVWTAKQERFVRDVCEKELASALKRSDFEAVLSATNGDVAVQDEEKHAAAVHQIQSSRPDVRSLVMDLAKDSEASTVAVLVCGPTAMVDEVRVATKEALLQTKRDIGYYEEAFAW